MKVFMIGGTGLLGCAAAQVFIDRGHSVKSVALPPLPVGAPIPKEMELSFGNYLEMTDEEIKEAMTGCDCFVFAAGVDERVEFPAPVYEAYKKYNIEPVRRLLTIAKECGVKSSVILGSYFSYFAKEYPEMGLCDKHPYIRSRIEQEKTALSFADDGMDVAVLELPYIFGTQPGRRPVWVILIEQLSNMGPVTMYPKGGTAMLTVRQVAESIVGAAERNKGGNAYPIGYYNLTWDEFLTVVHSAMGEPDRKIIHIKKWMFKLYGVKMMNDYKKRKIESGIDAVYLADIMCMNTFIDPKWSISLGVQNDDIKAAIYDSVKLSVDAFKGNQQLLGMKSE
ncbi:MAG: NAD-dependent epimerase/dehydratase family protein [Clostridiales bacterium]|nr:NAD-dependent epimerase/dehydratase family protein [Clostridiales bacterium]